MNEKAVLLSIQPKWCGLIANGKKTVEVRKTRPKIKTPFKVYIYCTNDRKNHFWTGKRYSYADERSHNAFDKDGNGKVIGEFICDAIISHCEMANADIAEQQGCIRREQLFEYANDAELYGWHISELKIYDKPKELEDFRTVCKYRNDDNSCQYEKIECNCVNFDWNPDGSLNFAECLDCLTRPPQSWRYVEVSGNE